jgi:hypothetical protein
MGSERAETSRDIRTDHSGAECCHSLRRHCRERRPARRAQDANVRLSVCTDFLRGSTVVADARRHLTRPQVSEFSAEQMSGWYAAHDVLGWSDELVLPESTRLEEAVQAIAAAAGLPQTGRDDDDVLHRACPITP